MLLIEMRVVLINWTISLRNAEEKLTFPSFARGLVSLGAGDFFSRSFSRDAKAFVSSSISIDVLFIQMQS
jgi:hypothetical protein